MNSTPHQPSPRNNPFLIPLPPLRQSVRGHQLYLDLIIKGNSQQKTKGVFKKCTPRGSGRRLPVPTYKNGFIRRHATTYLLNMDAQQPSATRHLAPRRTVKSFPALNQPCLLLLFGKITVCRCVKCITSLCSFSLCQAAGHDTEISFPLGTIKITSLECTQSTGSDMEWGVKKQIHALFLKLTGDSAARSPVRCKPERFLRTSSRLHESRSCFRSHAMEKGKKKRENDAVLANHF